MINQGAIVVSVKKISFTKYRSPILISNSSLFMELQSNPIHKIKHFYIYLTIDAIRVWKTSRFVLNINAYTQSLTRFLRYHLHNNHLKIKIYQRKKKSKSIIRFTFQLHFKIRLISVYHPLLQLN